jgi:NAD(P)-dependent dehydrogenase (short-subunit alcohol dehydrogenase family)
MAEGFASAGAHVILVGRDPAQADARLAKIKAAGGSGEFISCEATVKADLVKLRDGILAQHGKVDILVNGAGVNSATPFFEIDEAQLDKILTVNIKGVIFGCQVFGEAMVAAGKGYFVPVDVTSRDSLHALLDTVISRSGQVDILINGAGTNSPTPVLDIPEEEYQRIIDTNLSAIFRACQVFGRYFIDEARPASIINLGSISGLNPLSRVFTYSASKAAVHNLTRNLAREWADKDIRVNTLVPGFFPAEQNRKVLDESRVLDILRQTPASRFGNADELIGATLLLASAKAGSFITGIEMIVDGGFHAMTI